MHPKFSTAQANRALVQARNGVGAGFEYLFHELAGPVAAFSARQGADDPDGVANTALFEAYKGLPMFEGDYRAFRAFVFRIARNRIIDDYRKRSRRPQLTELRGEASRPVWEHTDERLGSEEWVTGMLEQLTEDQREVVMLRVLGDLSIEDTALIIGKPVTAVKALQRRAIRRLHKLTGEGVNQ
jgi:RNA polymerase sigma-70 factor (ECF subfamily)